MSINAELPTRFGLPAVNREGQFADPFMMDSALYMPRSIDTVWDYCFYLYYLNGPYRQAWKRVVSYFLTDLEFGGEEHGDDREQKELKEALIDQIDIMGHLGLGGQECGCYGNSFLTHYNPFDRVLVDDRDELGREYEVSLFEKFGPVKYDFKRMLYEVVDLKDAHKAADKRKRIKLRFRDRPSRDIKRFRIDRIDPREIILVEPPMGTTKIIRRFSMEFKEKVKSGDPFYVNEVPIEYLEAIANDQDFLYHPDHVFHLKMPTIRGLKNNGYGLPETIANYRSLHHLQVLRRIDEAVGMDYILPFRVFVPMPQAGGDSALVDTLMGSWKGEMQELISRRRQNPYAIHALPFPVQLQELGGGANGRQLVQAEAIEYHTNSLLDATGVPVEMYKGTMNLQNMPTALRLFEGSWQFFFHAFNRIVRWTSNAVQDMRRRSRLEISLAASNMADELEERGIYMQLVASGEISRARGYGGINIPDAIEEKKRRMQEDLEIQREQSKMEKQFQQEQTAGTLGQAPAAPGGGGGDGYGNPPAGANVTPVDRGQDAEQKAAEFLQIEDDGARRKAMMQLEATDEQMYALVKQKMEKMRSGAASQGRSQVGAMLQQQQQPPQ